MASFPPAPHGQLKLSNKPSKIKIQRKRESHAIRYHHTFHLVDTTQITYRPCAYLDALSMCLSLHSSLGGNGSGALSFEQEMQAYGMQAEIGLKVASAGLGGYEGPEWARDSKIEEAVGQGTKLCQQKAQSIAHSQGDKQISTLALATRLQVLMRPELWELLGETCESVEEALGFGFEEEMGHAQQTDSETNQSGSVVMQTDSESQESTSSSSATDPTPLFLGMKIHVLMLGILYHTPIANPKFASIRLSVLHDLLDSDALENFPAGAIYVTCTVGPPSHFNVTHPRILYELAFLASGVCKRDGVGRKPKMIRWSRAFISSTAKAKTAKLRRSSTSSDLSPDLNPERRVFLKQSLETRLVAPHLETQSYRPALGLIDGLLKELKRLGDKLILTELQAQLDLQSGILHAEDKDYKTRYSYFFEVFGNLSTNDDPKALTALKYMLLCKIMLNLPEDVTSLLQIKLAAR
ncbi:26S proteasome regulatory subunit rpn6 [Tulasnella sp. 424]|nr:26S proteasome regulatory subunit rpn6 [Tulasnella sp. 424]